MTVTYSQVPSQSQGIGTIPVTADTYRTEEVSGENDGRKAGAIDQDVSSMPKPADDDEERMGVPDDEVDDVDALRREVLSVAEAATRGDEIAAVSAMVTSAETAAVREAMAADVPDAAQDDHDDDRAPDEHEQPQPPPSVGKNAVAATFGARRRLNLEAVDLGAADVWGALSGGSQRADRSLSAGPDTQDALKDVGYSENGFESIDNRTATLTTTTTTTTPGNTQQPDGVSQLSAAHHPRTSEGEGSQHRKTVTFSLEPEERESEPEPQLEDEPQPEPEPQPEDDEGEDEEDDDEEILATQAWDPAADDDEEEEEEEDDEDDQMDEDDFGYAGGTQAAPPGPP